MQIRSPRGQEWVWIAVGAGGLIVLGVILNGLSSAHVGGGRRLTLQPTSPQNYRPPVQHRRH